VTSATWDELTAGLDASDLAKLTAFRDFCRSLPDVEERITATQISFARARSFATAYLKSHYLELGIDLLREVDDPRPRAVVPVSKTVRLNRYSLRELADFDERFRDLIREAADTVGPGARRPPAT
jgi:hypothetical protein